MIRDMKLLNKLYEVVSKNIDQLSTDQAIRLRDRINGRILKTLEVESWMFGQSDFTNRQFGIG